MRKTSWVAEWVNMLDGFPVLLEREHDLGVPLRWYPGMIAGGSVSGSPAMCNVSGWGGHAEALAGDLKETPVWELNMGYHLNVSIDKFPKQGSHKDGRVSVCFNYDTSMQVKGRVIRDDIEEPFCTIIQLDDGRVILATECQYSLL